MRARYDWADKDDHRPRRARAYEPDPAVSYANGQASRRETARHDPKNQTITPDEQKVLGERAREAAEARLADMDRRLLGAAQLGAALRELEG